MEDGGAAYSWKDVSLERGTMISILSSVRGVAMKETSSSGNWNPASLNAMPISLSLGKAV